ncbi:tetratricopeptide repeat protein [Acetobacter vaccinii]|uniref:Tetratricopeptide repeat protein n=1 Tax=Acetobacter vaccinii TaxID=2592655 RepID=A0A5C1YP79_9PROT|nr:tetratricopeptide repeat protein [Acetobacter vaccinii]QEO16887.1 tetratricopeptide repeat protein [Acetobacter vaccinii]
MSQRDVAAPLHSRMSPATGEALQRAGYLEEAAKAYERELAASPDDARIISNYSGLLNTLGDFTKARTLALRATTLQPDLADAWCNLGNTCIRLQQYEEGIAAYRHCLERQPEHALALSNLGSALDFQGRHELAQKFHQVAVQLTPDNAQTRSNYALSLLAQGKYREGFEEYEWRWNTLEARRRVHTLAPVWKGEAFVGRTLLVQTEGGFGDVIQFSRFLPQVAERGGRVLMQVRPQLLRLLRQSFPDQEFVSQDDPTPAHDLQCPVLSLPYALGTTLETIPFPQVFLRADPHAVAGWADLLRQDPTGTEVPPLRIGLVWAGAPHPDVRAVAFADKRRSTDLATFAPLAAAVPGAVFYSLQVGEKSVQARTPPRGMRLIDHTSLLGDFADTAALVSTLDLVVAVDTSTAHVAAGLGKPVWLLSRYDQCWRWLSGRDDSPWYNSVRIYQQKAPFDWSVPMARMVADLGIFAQAHRLAAQALR